MTIEPSQSEGGRALLPTQKAIVKNEYGNRRWLLRNDQTPRRLDATARGGLEDRMTAARRTSVPKAMQATHDMVVALTDAVCEKHLDEDYRDLARDMAAALCRKRPSPLAKGQPRTWACGIVHTLGQVNFLSDKASRPYMTMAELCAAFGVGQSTASAKARVITNALRVSQMVPEWMLPSLIAQNPLIWMAEINGFIVDLRDMPRELQEIAYGQGLIPYIPADERQGDQAIDHNYS